MTQIVVAMAVIVFVAAVVVAYVAFPHRGEDLPGAPWLGRLMRKGARSLPTVEPEPTDVVSPDRPAGESPFRTQPVQPGETGVGPQPGPSRAQVRGQHRA